MGLSKEKRTAFVNRLKELNTLDLAIVADEPDINIPFEDIIKELDENPDFKQQIRTVEKMIGYRIMNNLAAYSRGVSVMDNAPNAAIAKLMLETFLPEKFGKQKVEDEKPPEDIPDDVRSALGLETDKK